MTREEALEFLRQHQPMPPDNEITTELIDRYDNARKYFVEHPDIEAVPLLLNSFGQGSGFGVYQVVYDAIHKLPAEAVIPHLMRAIESEHPGVRYWSAQIASGFPSPELIPGLINLLQSDDEDTQFASATALEQIDDPRVDKIFREMLKNSKNPDLCEQISEALVYRQEKGQSTSTR